MLNGRIAPEIEPETFFPGIFWKAGAEQPPAYKHKDNKDEIKDEDIKG